MRILFIYRVYGENEINPVVQNQMNALRNNGIDIIEFTIKNGGIINYIKSILNLFFFSLKNHFDIIHAHYSYSGFLSFFGTLKKPIICSLMGSDVIKSKRIKRHLILFFAKNIWFKTIVKSKNMRVENSLVIPNGVDFNNFRPIDKRDAIIHTGFSKEKINIIFVASDIKTEVKNYPLAKKTVDSLGKNYTLHTISEVKFSELPYYYSAANMLLLTSFSEGSPNVVKEALACNCPVVSTDVGDVKEITKDIESCIITSFDSKEIGKAIVNITKLEKQVSSRDKIDFLNNDTILNKIQMLYKSVLTK